MTQVNFSNTTCDSLLKFAVIIAKSVGKCRYVSIRCKKRVDKNPLECYTMPR